MADRAKPITATKTWLFVGLQWVTTGTSLLLASQRWPTTQAESNYYTLVTAVVVFLAFAATVWWVFVAKRVSAPSVWGVTFLAVIPVAIVSSTNWWQSPYVFLLFNSVVVAAYSFGLTATVLLSVAASLTISVPYLLAGVSATGMTDQSRVNDAVRWSTVMVFIGFTSSYAVKISRGSSVDENLVKDLEIVRLRNANSLLADLHGVAQQLTTSFDEEDITSTSLKRLRNFFSYDAATLVFKEDDVGGGEIGWRVAAKESDMSMGLEGETDSLPVFVREAIASQEPSMEENETIVAVPLVARGETNGFLCVRRKSSGVFTENELDILTNFASALALTVDNARLFVRLRTLGAEEERSRIARDLHDSVGQSLVFLGLTAESLIDESEGTQIEKGRVVEFRDEIRDVLADVRSTLYDLRTDVTASRSLEEVLVEYAQRVEKRSGVRVVAEVDSLCALPLSQERELWRIAQEAIVNAEKHSGCTDIRIRWGREDGACVLSVEDNGGGFDTASEAETERYGVRGMKERAAAINAKMVITSAPERGTSVVCTVTARGRRVGRLGGLSSVPKG